MARSFLGLGQLVVLLVLLSVAVRYSDSKSCVTVRAPSVALSGIPFSVQVTLLPFLSGDEVIPEQVYIIITGAAVSSNENDTDPLFNLTTTFSNGSAYLTHTLSPLSLANYGYQNLSVAVTNTSHDLLCSPVEMEILVIPGILTLFPPIITTFMAIVFRQVMVAMFVGILAGSFFLEGYNPVTAFARTLDQHLVGAYSSWQHAQVMTIVILLGGTIGLIQKSGGTIAMVKVFHKIASSPRRACLVTLSICLLLFNDDYAIVLITGYSMSKIVEQAGVSKEKFAFIIQSMAPCLASGPPLMGWVPSQMGYLLSGFEADSCSTPEPLNPYIIIVSTLPYRFLTYLMICCVILVCFLSRDFGPMLTAERKARRLLATRLVGSLEEQRDEGEDERREEGASQEGPAGEGNGAREEQEQHGSDDLLAGPLSPKPGVPHRWYYAVIPLAMMIVVTLIGMIVDGYLHITYWNQDHYGDQRINMTVLSVLSSGDAMSSLMWSTFLATLLLLVMLICQRVLTFRECIEAWLEGVKDLTEPMMVLNLSWALGGVIQELQTSNFIAQAIRGSIPTHYIPGITTAIGYFMSFSIGSAYGTMGILFPLIIPTVCQLTPGDDNSNTLRVQTAAAILSSAIFGNLISPLADLTILSRISTKCDINAHLKTAALYVLLVGGLAVLLGALPVGAGWYPWYVGWILMVAALVVVFLLFSSGHSTSSRSLCRIGCPCLFSLATKLLRSLSDVREALMQKCFKRRHKSNLQIQGRKQT